MQPREICLGYINYLYQDSKTGIQSKNINQTYGEILPQSATPLINYLNLSPADSFLDLGSGLGKLLLQVFLETSVQKAIGIEIDGSLNQQAQTACDIARKELPEFFINREINFIHSDFLKCDLPAVTHVLIASPCFTPSLLECLVAKLNEIDSIQCLISLRPLLTLNKLKFYKTMRLECSWDSALAYIYIL